MNARKTIQVVALACAVTSGASLGEDRSTHPSPILRGSLHAATYAKQLSLNEEETKKLTDVYLPYFASMDQTWSSECEMKARTRAAMKSAGTAFDGTAMLKDADAIAQRASETQRGLIVALGKAFEAKRAAAIYVMELDTLSARTCSL